MIDYPEFDLSTQPATITTLDGIVLNLGYGQEVWTTSRYDSNAAVRTTADYVVWDDYDYISPEWTGAAQIDRGHKQYGQYRGHVGYTSMVGLTRKDITDLIDSIRSIQEHGAAVTHRYGISGQGGEPRQDEIFDTKAAALKEAEMHSGNPAIVVVPLTIEESEQRAVYALRIARGKAEQAEIDLKRQIVDARRAGLSENRVAKESGKQRPYVKKATEEGDI